MTETAVELPNPLDNLFWIRPGDEIERDLAVLRAEAPVAFLPEPEIPEHVPLPRGPGSWVLTRHADILHVSKHPELFSSAGGITQLDYTPEFNEFSSSIIAMDEPRHARLRKVV
jgi:cytochrome P450